MKSESQIAMSNGIDAILKVIQLRESSRLEKENDDRHAGNVVGLSEPKEPTNEDKNIRA